ncbi:MAG: nucleotidyltransferase family protein [archaeon]
MKKRITMTLDKGILKKVDGTIDNITVKNRSAAVEKLVRKAFQINGISKAVVLAGGIGTRLRPLTYEVPKSLIPIQGRALVEHLILNLKSFGINDILLSVGHMSEKIIAHLGDGNNLGVNIEYLVEKEPLGTAGPLRLAKGKIDSTFVMMNGDLLSKIDVLDMLQTHLNSNSTGTIALTTVKDPSRFGVATLNGSAITGFIEKPKDRISNLINAGLYIFEPSIVDYLPNKKKAMLEKDVFPKLAKQGKLSGYVYSGPWYDLGTNESYEKAIKEWK